MRKVFLVIVVSMACNAQTKINLGTQASTPDFSLLTHTRPWQVGSGLPVTCSSGEAYFLVTNAAGQQQYNCSSTNTWTQVGGSGGSSSFTINTTAPLTGGPFGGSGTMTLACPTCAYTTNSTTWGSGTSQDFSGTAHTKPSKAGIAASVPSTCSVGETYFATDATPGQNWYFCTATNVWTQQLNSGSGGGGSGITSLGQATDCLMSISGAVLTVTAPCNVRFHGLTTRITTTATATNTSTSGAGVVWVYVDTNGQVNFSSSDLTITCTTGPCLIQTAGNIPSNSIPIGQWTSNLPPAWDSGGYTDYRAWLANDVVGGGTGVICTDSPGSTACSMDTSILSLIVAAPGSHTSTCTTNQIAYSSTYFYVCVGTNSWVRVALSNSGF